MSQVDTENDKNPKNLLFSMISYISSKVLTDFVIWNVATGQKGKIVLSSKLRKEMNAVFQTKCTELTSKKTNFQNFSDLVCFRLIFVKILIHLVDWKDNTPEACLLFR